MRFMIRTAALALLAASVAACSSTESTLDPKAADANAPAVLTPQASAPATPAAATPGAAAVQPAMANARVQFAPIVGSTVAAVTPLSRRLTLRAKENGLKIVPANDPSTTHLVKGYFSAFSDKGMTTVIHVWDIMDNAGNRLTRFQGEEKTPGEASDPWSIIPQATMEGIGDRVMRELAQWIATHPV